MSGRTTVYRVGAELNRMEAIIIQLNTGDRFSYSADGGLPTEVKTLISE